LRLAINRNWLFTSDTIGLLDLLKLLRKLEMASFIISYEIKTATCVMGAVFCNTVCKINKMPVGRVYERNRRKYERNRGIYERNRRNCKRGIEKFTSGTAESTSGTEKFMSGIGETASVESRNLRAEPQKVRAESEKV